MNEVHFFVLVCILNIILVPCSPIQTLLANACDPVGGSAETVCAVELSSMYSGIVRYTGKTLDRLEIRDLIENHKETSST